MKKCGIIITYIENFINKNVWRYWWIMVRWLVLNTFELCINWQHYNCGTMLDKCDSSIVVPLIRKQHIEGIYRWKHRQHTEDICIWKRRQHTLFRDSNWPVHTPNNLLRGGGRGKNVERRGGGGRCETGTCFLGIYILLFFYDSIHRQELLQGWN